MRIQWAENVLHADPKFGLWFLKAALEGYLRGNLPNISNMRTIIKLNKSKHLHFIRWNCTNLLEFCCRQTMAKHELNSVQVQSMNQLLFSSILLTLKITHLKKYSEAI